MQKESSCVEIVGVMDKPLQMFLTQIGSIRSQILQIRLFGSRAKGKERPDSDYDLFLVVRKRDPKLIDTLYEAVMDVLLATGRLISLKIFPEEEFLRLSKLKTPFMEAVRKEGVSLE